MKKLLLLISLMTGCLTPVLADGPIYHDSTPPVAGDSCANWPGIKINAATGLGFYCDVSGGAPGVWAVVPGSGDNAIAAEGLATSGTGAVGDCFTGWRDKAEVTETFVKFPEGKCFDPEGAVVLEPRTVWLGGCDARVMLDGTQTNALTMGNYSQLLGTCRTKGVGSSSSGFILEIDGDDGNVGLLASGIDPTIRNINLKNNAADKTFTGIKVSEQDWYLLENVTVTGDYHTAGVHLYLANYGRLENVIVMGGDNAGSALKIEGSIDARIHGFQTDMGDIGIEITSHYSDPDTTGARVYLDECVLDNTGSAGIYVRSSACKIMMANATHLENWTTGVKFDDSGPGSTGNGFARFVGTQFINSVGSYWDKSGVSENYKVAPLFTYYGIESENPRQCTWDTNLDSFCDQDGVCVMSEIAQSGAGSTSSEWADWHIAASDGTCPFQEYSGGVFSYDEVSALEFPNPTMIVLKDAQLWFEDEGVRYNSNFTVVGDGGGYINGNDLADNSGSRLVFKNGAQTGYAMACADTSCDHLNLSRFAIIGEERTFNDPDYSFPTADNDGLNVGHVKKGVISNVGLYEWSGVSLAIDVDNDPADGVFDGGQYTEDLRFDNIEIRNGCGMGTGDDDDEDGTGVLVRNAAGELSFEGVHIFHRDTAIQIGDANSHKRTNSLFPQSTWFEDIGIGLRGSYGIRIFAGMNLSFRDIRFEGRTNDANLIYIDGVQDVIGDATEESSVSNVYFDSIQVGQAEDNVFFDNSGGVTITNIKVAHGVAGGTQKTPEPQASGLYPISGQNLFGDSNFNCWESSTTPCYWNPYVGADFDNDAGTTESVVRNTDDAYIRNRGVKNVASALVGDSGSSPYENRGVASHVIPVDNSKTYGLGFWMKGSTANRSVNVLVRACDDVTDDANCDDDDTTTDILTEQIDAPLDPATGVNWTYVSGRKAFLRSFNSPGHTDWYRVVMPLRFSVDTNEVIIAFQGVGGGEQPQIYLDRAYFGEGWIPTDHAPGYITNSGDESIYGDLDVTGELDVGDADIDGTPDFQIGSGDGDNRAAFNGNDGSTSYFVIRDAKLRLETQDGTGNAQLIMEEILVNGEPAGGTDEGSLFCADDGAGNTELYFRGDTGSTQQVTGGGGMFLGGNNIADLDDVAATCNATDDEVMVGDGTDYEGLPLPDADATGVCLQYDTTANAFSPSGALLLRDGSTAGGTTDDQEFQNGLYVSGSSLAVDSHILMSGGGNDWTIWSHEPGVVENLFFDNTDGGNVVLGEPNSCDLWVRGDISPVVDGSGAIGDNSYTWGSVYATNYYADDFFQGDLKGDVDGDADGNPEISTPSNAIYMNPDSDAVLGDYQFTISGGVPQMQTANGKSIRIRAGATGGTDKVYVGGSRFELDFDDDDAVGVSDFAVVDGGPYSSAWLAAMDDTSPASLAFSHAVVRFAGSQTGWFAGFQLDMSGSAVEFTPRYYFTSMEKAKADWPKEIWWGTKAVTWSGMGSDRYCFGTMCLEEIACGAETCTLFDFDGDSTEDAGDKCATDGLAGWDDDCDGTVDAGGSGGEYTIQVWAEENSALGASNTYEWAFGNGANTASDEGLIVYVPSGWTCTAIAMTVRLGTSSTATIELVINGTPQGANANVTVTAGVGGTNDSFTPVSISSGDYINFRTTSSSGTSGNNIVSVVLRYVET